MSTLSSPSEDGSTKTVAGEARLVVPDVSWSVYETWIGSLPESTPVRMAYDGRDLELMTKGPDYEDFRQLLGHLVIEIARFLKRPIKGLGETTWRRPDLERGIEADQCYFLSPAKMAATSRSRGANDVSALPNPDLVIEVDLSPSQLDRPGIYAAMGVTEVWRFDGTSLTIEELRPNGRYADVEASAFLLIHRNDLTRWLVQEDAIDEIAWIERLAAWLRNEWRQPR